MSIGENLKKIRTNNGLTQEELAKKVDVHRTMIMLIETGRKNPSVALIRDIAEALKCKTDDLIKI